MLSKNIKNNKIIVVLGTTASGKTKLGVKLAHKFNGEIISADSRQVYRGMDIGTGKDLDEYIIKSKVINIPYHLIDVVSPKTEFNLAKYQKLAYKAVNDILERDRLPIIVGGTGLYLQAVVDGYNLPAGRPNKILRQALERKTIKQLLVCLKKINQTKFISLNNSEKNNKRRLIRLNEIAGEVKLPMRNLASSKYDFFLIGLTWPREVLRERINKRLIERLAKEDMIGEVERLHKQDGVSWKRLDDFGLEYRYIAQYLQGKLNYNEMVEKLNITIRQFAKKQMTWLHRWEKQGAKIHWVDNLKEAKILTKKFLG